MSRGPRCARRATLTVRLPKPLVARLRREAALRDASASYLVREALFENVSPGRRGLPKAPGGRRLARRHLARARASARGAGARVAWDRGRLGARDRGRAAASVRGSPHVSPRLRPAAARLPRRARVAPPLRG